MRPKLEPNMNEKMRLPGTILAIWNWARHEFKCESKLLLFKCGCYWMFIVTEYIPCTQYTIFRNCIHCFNWMRNTIIVFLSFYLSFASFLFLSFFISFILFFSFFLYLLSLCVEFSNNSFGSMLPFLCTHELIRALDTASLTLRLFLFVSHHLIIQCLYGWWLVISQVIASFLYEYELMISCKSCWIIGVRFHFEMHR